MLMYEIKIICQHTKELLYYSLDKKPSMPTPEQMKKYSGILVISTVDSATAAKDSQSNLTDKQRESA